MELEFSLSADTEHEIKLESSLISANWRSGKAIAGGKAAFEIRTALVGEGARITITGKSESGESLGKIKDVIRHNKYIGEFEIPEKLELDDTIFFEVKLSKNDIKGESNRIPVCPPVHVSNMKWSEKVAGRGDILTLSADIDGVRNGTELKVTIYEFDADGANEKITEFPVTVEDKKIEVLWEYEYHDSTLKIPTEGEIQRYDKKTHYAHPEYFFTLDIYGMEYGKGQESGLLRFMDLFNFELRDDDGKPFANEKYILMLADGTKREGTLDENGEGCERDLPPGEITIILPECGYVFGR